MKLLLAVSAILLCIQSYASGQLSCFTTYKTQKLGLVQEKTFEALKKDSAISVDGELISVDLTNNQSSTITLAPSAQIDNTRAMMDLTFVPLNSFNPEDKSWHVTGIKIFANGVSVTHRLTEGNTTEIEFAKEFIYRSGKKLNTYVSLDCSVLR